MVACQRDVVVFRNGDAQALRRVWTLLQWDIVRDVTPEANDVRTLVARHVNHRSPSG